MRHGRRGMTLGGVVATLLVAAGLAGCGGGHDAAGTPTNSGGGVVRLGALLPLSGRSAPSGEAMRQAARLAIKEANDAGGVLGRRVELVVADDACDPGTAVIAAHRMISQGVTVSVGGYCSSATVPTLPIFRDASVPMVIPAANSTELLQPGYDNVFLISGTVAAEARFAVASMHRLGTASLVIVHDATSFPATLANATATAAAADGVPVTATLELSQGAPTYARIAREVLATRANMVYYTGYYAEANQLIRDLRTAGYQGKIMVGDGAAATPLLGGLSAAQTQSLYGTALLVPELMPSLSGWLSRYTSFGGSPPLVGTAETYDAVTIALDAIKRAGTTEHAAVRRAIAQTSGLSLLSGPARFAADGTRSNPSFLLLVVRAGRFVEVP
ncbi:MAG TPA: branched-chain amino acid ABC transporter substrate-binding protein [Kineosporiaceae bacterium]